jgi:hypothetical protein
MGGDNGGRVSRFVIEVISRGARATTAVIQGSEALRPTVAERRIKVGSRDDDFCRPAISDLRASERVMLTRL